MRSSKRLAHTGGAESAARAARNAGAREPVSAGRTNEIELNMLSSSLRLTSVRSKNARSVSSFVRATRNSCGVRAATDRTRRSAVAATRASISRMNGVSSELELTTATAPPGASTRSTSAAAGATSKKCRASAITTRSKLALGNGNASAFACTVVSVTPRSAARRPSAAIMSAAGSTAVTDSPRAASGNAKCPSPAPSSSTRRPSVSVTCKASRSALG